MLTIFTVPKPFTDHLIATIQTNAITSWLTIPGVEVILFGNECGVAEIAQKMNLRHIPDVKDNEVGTPIIGDFFKTAQATAKHDIVCYSNADIIFAGPMHSIIDIFEKEVDKCLIVGRRWNMDIAFPIDFNDRNWSANLITRAQKENPLMHHTQIDYFIFRKNSLGDIPPFALGRPTWDNWMIWNALKKGVKVVDSGNAIYAIHQNHHFKHLPTQNYYDGSEAKENLRLAGGWPHLRNLLDANYKLCNGRILKNHTVIYWLRKLRYFAGDIKRQLFPADEIFKI
jgi:hypothetical protein